MELSINKYLAIKDVQMSFKSGNEGQNNAAVPAHLEQGYVDVIRASSAHGRLQKIKDLLPRLPTIQADNLDELLSQCLVDAAEYGHSDVVEYLFEEGAVFSYRIQPSGRTALHVASREGHIDTVKSILRLVSDVPSTVEMEDDEGYTPWMYAIERGSVGMLQAFLDSFPHLDLEITTPHGQTTAHLAARSRKEHMIRFLHEKQVDFTKRDNDGEAPIHIVLFQSSREPDGITDYREDYFLKIVRLLFRPEDLCAKTSSGRNFLHHLAQAPPALANLIWQDIRKDPVFEETVKLSHLELDGEKKTPLHLTIQKVLERLAKHDGPSFDSYAQLVQSMSAGYDGERQHLAMKDGEGCTPIMALAKGLRYIEVRDAHSFSANVLKVFRTLGAAGRDDSFRKEQDNYQRSILHFIAGCRTRFPFHEITSYVLEGPVDLDLKDSIDHFPLTRAACGSQGNVDFIRLLLPKMDQGLLQHQDSEGKTILHHICGNKKPRIQDVIDQFQFLLALIAKCEKRDSEGRIPLSYASEIISDESIATRLVEMAGENVGLCDNEGRNCMYWSCQIGSNAMVKVLLEAGTDVDAVLGPGSELGATKNPPILIAAKSRNFDVVQLLLDNGANPLVRGQGDWQLQHFASLIGYQPLLSIIAEIPEIDYQSKATVSHDFTASTNEQGSLTLEDATPLHLAALNSDKEAMQWLLTKKKPLDINVRTRSGHSPLMLASTIGSFENCKLLLEAGASVSGAANGGFTALHAACCYGHAKICKLIIDADGKSIFERSGHETPLEISARRGHLEVVRMLLKNGCDVTTGAEVEALNSGQHEIASLIRERLIHDYNALADDTTKELDAMRLRTACESLSEDALVELLQQDTNPNIRLDDQHQTPLHISGRHGWVRAINSLILRGAATELMDWGGMTPLLVAICRRNWECAKLLHQKGAWAGARSAAGSSALHLSAYAGIPEACSYFLELGIDANIRAYNGTTPLHWTTDPKCVETLLQHGADPFVVSIVDTTATWMLCGRPEGGDFLRKIFHKQPSEKILRAVNTFDREMNSPPLYRAAFRGISDATTVLIEHGAEINACGGDGAPIHAALRQGYVEIATILLANGARPYRVVRDGTEHAVWYWEYGYHFSFPTANGSWASHEAWKRNVEED